MLIWLLVNILLSVLALVFVHVNRSAPHRLRFHVVVLALACWLVPWSKLTLVSHWLPHWQVFDFSRAELALAARTAEATQVPLFIVDTRSVPLTGEFVLVNLPLLALLGLLAIGLVLFGYNLLRHHLRLRSLRSSALDISELWHRHGIDAEVPIYLQQHISGAFSSGIVEPVVWVHADLAAAPELPTLLRHELTHIQQYDNAWLLLITLVEKVFWWNPLAWYLGRTARELQELSCDERCQHSDADYPAHLAQLMLANLSFNRSGAREPLLLSANIFTTHNPDIQRLKVLQRSHHMKPRHIVSAIATAVLAIAGVGLVTAQQSTIETRTGEGNVMFVKRIAGPGQDAPQDQVVHFTVNKDDADPQSAPAPGQRIGMFGVQAPGGQDQFMKVMADTNGIRVTFKFDNAALPVVLGPLANLLAMPAPDVSVAGNGGNRKEVRVMRRGEGGATPNGATTGGKFEFPVSPQLDLQVDTARTRQVTVSGNDMSLSDALTAIGKAANCNVIKNGDKIVVDWCGADPNN